MKKKDYKMIRTIWRKKKTNIELLEIMELENSVDEFNCILDTAEESVKYGNVKKLSIMQHRDAKIGTSIKRFRDMENKDQSFNIHLVRGPEGEELVNRGATIFKKRMASEELMKKTDKNL